MDSATIPSHPPPQGTLNPWSIRPPNNCHDTTNLSSPSPHRHPVRSSLGGIVRVEPYQSSNRPLFSDLTPIHNGLHRPTTVYDNSHFDNTTHDYHTDFRGEVDDLPHSNRNISFNMINENERPAHAPSSHGGAGQSHYKAVTAPVVYPSQYTQPSASGRLQEILGHPSSYTTDSFDQYHNHPYLLPPAPITPPFFPLRSSASASHPQSIFGSQLSSPINTFSSLSNVHLLSTTAAQTDSIFMSPDSAQPVDVSVSDSDSDSDSVSDVEEYTWPRPSRSLEVARNLSGAVEVDGQNGGTDSQSQSISSLPKSSSEIDIDNDNDNDHDDDDDNDDSDDDETDPEFVPNSRFRLQLVRRNVTQVDARTPRIISRKTKVKAERKKRRSSGNKRDLDGVSVEVNRNEKIKREITSSRMGIRKGQKTSAALPTGDFLFAAYHMLTDPTYSEWVHWDPVERVATIYNTIDFAKDVYSKNATSSKWESFQRNMTNYQPWGFKRTVVPGTNKRSQTVEVPTWEHVRSIWVGQGYPIDIFRHGKDKYGIVSGQEKMSATTGVVVLGPEVGSDGTNQGSEVGGESGHQVDVQADEWSLESEEGQNYDRDSDTSDEEPLAMTRSLPRSEVEHLGLSIDGKRIRISPWADKSERKRRKLTIWTPGSTESDQPACPARLFSRSPSIPPTPEPTPVVKTSYSASTYTSVPVTPTSAGPGRSFGRIRSSRGEAGV
ncbi:hypothetical protein IAR55_004255 [Kwoniella newhampshirensis]|uniref:HSF-type DNA-binding domain-containing protein n=1 Tax=Kwoniella newhampshirensis TaxID=1651941 RepID=A0AAW0YX00_9TREE